PIDEVEDQRQRRKQLVVLRQMLTNKRIVFVWDAVFVEVVRPSSEDLLRPLIEREPREPITLHLDRAPFNRIEVRQLLEHLARATISKEVWRLVGPLPLHMVRKNQQLKSLHRSVVANLAGNLLQKGRQHVRLDAAEKRDVKHRDVDMPPAN